MKLYDMVELNSELEDLAKRGIHKDCHGTIVKYTQNKSLVLFTNRMNSGDYAFAWVENKYLTYIRDYYEDLFDDLQHFLTTHNPAEKTAFHVLKLKEYDAVELIVEKKAYAKYGVHKGMQGCIMDPQAIDGKWYVIFTAEGGDDIADICVKEEDLKKI